MSQAEKNTYTLTEENQELATKKGLVSARWYTSPVPREKIRQLLTRRNGPAIRDTILWFALLLASGSLGYVLWGSWWAIIPFAVYGVVYGSASDSRWHEALHGTAFKTDWMNNVLYEIASFMVLRESIPWRWSHFRHHTDTIIVGRDPEIHVPRPPDIKGLILAIFSLGSGPHAFRLMVFHACGKLTDAEQSYVPKNEHRRVYFIARIYLLIYGAVIGLSITLGSILPLMYIGLPSFYGSFMIIVYGLTQHAGLAENILDHRLNTRTVYMNIVNRYLYWNMNYHLEHHLFPLVPYHALPELHQLIKHDCPPAYPGLVTTWKEIIPALLRQVKDPTYFVERILPTPSAMPDASDVSKTVVATGKQTEGGWIDVCHSDKLEKEDVLRFDYENKTYAIYRTVDDEYYAADGLCTHGKTHLVDGMVKGYLIECPKHNGRFDIRDGSPQRRPACKKLQTYAVSIKDGRLLLDVTSRSSE
jgi:Na+-transporting NADH:ubiquinone oxidoreductase subunit F